jgi:glucosyl-3-phosphoglycerate phosphatase
MNYLKKVNSLRNNYVVLRHGESEANERGIIISEPAKGIKDYGLTVHGRKQVTSSVQKAKEKGLLDGNVIIYSSDFKRAEETAIIAKAILKSGEVNSTSNLRERYFGDFDSKSRSNYARVWANDLTRRSNFHNVESVDSVLSRTTKLITELEKRYDNKTILLVGHADTLQILQTAFEDNNPFNHRLLKPIRVAQVRALNNRV